MSDKLRTRLTSRPCTQCGLFLALAVTLLLTIAASGDGTLPGDTAVARAVQSVDHALASDFAFTLNETYALPGIAVITAVIAVVLAATGNVAYMLLVLATGLSQLTNAGLKALADSPRPHAGLVEVSERASGLGYPSGHTMSVVVLSGIVIYVAAQMIAQRRLRWVVQAVAAMQILGIAFSRVYTGAHWPSDVLGGLLWGAWFTVALIVLYRRFVPRSPADLSEVTA